MAPDLDDRRTRTLLHIMVALGSGLALTAVARPSTRSVDPAPECAVPSCRNVPPEPPSPLSSTATCPAAGYLCAELEQARAIRVLRWSSGQGPLRVRVDLPLHEDAPRARDLVLAAVRGIQAWQGRPFDLAISDRDRRPGAPADIHVTWTARLDGVALGTTHTQWEGTPGGGSFTSVRVVLATRSPFNGRFPLSPEDVTLVAAHEMGHALGLPHSDDPADVMYPTNTARRLSARDYRTMEALYRLPAGVRIVSDGSSPW